MGETIGPLDLMSLPLKDRGRIMGEAAMKKETQEYYQNIAKQQCSTGGEMSPEALRELDYIKRMKVQDAAAAQREFDAIEADRNGYRAEGRAQALRDALKLIEKLKFTGINGREYCPVEDLKPKLKAMIKES